MPKLSVRNWIKQWTFLITSTIGKVSEIPASGILIFCRLVSKYPFMKSYCSTCNRETNQKVLKEEKLSTTNEYDGWWDDNTFQIIQCGGCDEVSFRKLYNDVSMQQHHEEDTTFQELYPQRGAHSRPIKTYRGLPFQISTIYRETIDTFNSNLKILCAVGIRAIVEAICVDKNIIDGKITTKEGKEYISKSLNGKIAGLHTMGFLTLDSSEVLHELRFMGNDAVHDIVEPSTEELSVAIDIIEHVIENIYMIKRKAIGLKEKRNARKGS